MSRVRRNSSPELCPSPSTTMVEKPDDSSFEGVATNVKLLLKLVQDHNQACARDHIDDRQVQRVAGMMSILDDVKSRIQKSHSFPFGKKREAELRRCNTDLRPNHVPRDKKANELIMDEKQKLRRELNASLAARKSLEMMCSSVGKEKEFMAAELARKVHEVSGMEELVNDLKAQNEMLLAKVQTCAAEHKEKKCISSRGGGGGEISQGNVALQERNKALSAQLLKSLDGYRSLKRKLKDAQEENSELHATMEEIGEEVEVGLERIRGFQQQMVIGKNNEQEVNIEEEILALQHMFECLKIKVSEHGKKKS